MKQRNGNVIAHHDHVRSACSNHSRKLPANAGQPAWRYIDTNSATMPTKRSLRPRVYRLAPSVIAIRPTNMRNNCMNVVTSATPRNEVRNELAWGRRTTVRNTVESMPSSSNTPFSGTPIALPGTIQAENYDAAVAIAKECPGDNLIEIRELGGYA